MDWNIQVIPNKNYCEYLQRLQPKKITLRSFYYYGSTV